MAVLCSLVCAGETEGHSLPWTCIYSSDSVHGANGKEYISLLLLKIPRIAKQDLAFSFFLRVCVSPL